MFQLHTTRRSGAATWGLFRDSLSVLRLNERVCPFYGVHYFSWAPFMRYIFLRERVFPRVHENGQRYALPLDRPGGTSFAVPLLVPVKRVAMYIGPFAAFELDCMYKSVAGNDFELLG